MSTAIHLLNAVHQLSKNLRAERLTMTHARMLAHLAHGAMSAGELRASVGLIDGKANPYLLELLRLAEVRPSGPVCFYQITPHGREVLASLTAPFNQLTAPRPGVDTEGQAPVEDERAALIAEAEVKLARAKDSFAEARLSGPAVRMAAQNDLARAEYRLATLKAQAATKAQDADGGAL